MNLPNLTGHITISVKVTYEREFYAGVYGEKRRKMQTTRLGFWDGEKFHVPPGWTHFTFSNNEVGLVPEGWGGDHLTPRSNYKLEICN